MWILNYNPGHNILELYNILVLVRFITSKTKLNVYYIKLGTRVVAYCPVSPQEIRLWQWQLKYT